MPSDLLPERVNPPQLSGNRPMQLLGAALAAISVRPSRAVFAEWMRIVRPEQIRLYALLLYGLIVLNAWVSAGARLVELNDTHLVNLVSMLPGVLIVAVLVAPCAVLLGIAVTISIVAALMPAAQGTLNHRSYLLLRPFLLAQLASVTVEVLLNLLTLPLQLRVVTQHLPVNTWQPLVDIAIVVYGLILLTNALAAVSTRSRWLLVASILLGLGTELLLWVLFRSAVLPSFGIHTLP
jgi:hypothetical protein